MSINIPDFKIDRFEEEIAIISASISSAGRPSSINSRPISPTEQSFWIILYLAGYSILRISEIFNRHRRVLEKRLNPIREKLDEIKLKPPLSFIEVNPIKISYGFTTGKVEDGLLTLENQKENWIPLFKLSLLVWFVETREKRHEKAKKLYQWLSTQIKCLNLSGEEKQPTANAILSFCSQLQIKEGIDPFSDGGLLDRFYLLFDSIK